jgi:hypothetical protein
MDRTLIQERPHQVIEGMILAALAVAARYGVIYVRKEYEDAVRRLEHALFQARRKGLLGENIFNSAGLHFDIETMSRSPQAGKSAPSCTSKGKRRNPAQRGFHLSRLWESPPAQQCGNFASH